MTFGVLEALLATADVVRLAVGRAEVAMDELDQAVQVLDRDRLVLLVEVVDVAVEDLNEELDRHGRVHAGVGDAERALETFEHALAVAVELGMGGSVVGLAKSVEAGKRKGMGKGDIHLWDLLLRARGSLCPTINGWQGRRHGIGRAS